MKYTKSGIYTDDSDNHHDMPGMSWIPPMYLEDSTIERYENMTLQFWAHIYLQDFNGNVTDSEGVQAYYTVAGGTEMKVEIGNFPFSSTSSEIALQTMLRENFDMNETRFENVIY